MDFSREGLFCKAKSIASCVSGIMLWASRLPIPSSPMHISIEEYPITHDPQNLQRGLKTLINSKDQEPTQYPSFIIHSYMIPSSSSSSSSLSSSSYNSSWSSMLDDLIGTESGVCMMSSSNIEEEIYKQEPYSCNIRNNNVKQKMNQRCVMTREYPPPIPLLARTGNLPAHMPWVLTRNYSDGKLTLNIERVKHHEYLEAYRENGRLILNLVPLEDTIKCYHSVSDQRINDHQGVNNQELELEFIDEEVQDNQETDHEADHNIDEDIKMVDEMILYKGSITIPASSVPKSCLEINGSESCGYPRKCFTYAGRMISESSLFCNTNNQENAAANCMALPGSAPLAFNIRATTTVM